MYTNGKDDVLDVRRWAAGDKIDGRTPLRSRRRRGGRHCRCSLGFLPVLLCCLLWPRVDLRRSSFVYTRVASTFVLSRAILPNSQCRVFCSAALLPQRAVQKGHGLLADGTAVRELHEGGRRHNVLGATVEKVRAGGREDEGFCFLRVNKLNEGVVLPFSVGG